MDSRKVVELYNVMGELLDTWIKSQSCYQKKKKEEVEDGEVERTNMPLVF